MEKIVCTVLFVMLRGLSQAERGCLEKPVCKHIIFCYMYTDFVLKGNALVEKQRISLVDAHKGGCPWRSRQCDRKLLNVPLFKSFLDLSSSSCRFSSFNIPDSLTITGCYC